MNKRLLTVPFVFVMLAALLALPVSAKVPGNVLTVGPGQEYATIQSAVDAARPGSRILVYPDIYSESVSITKNNLHLLAQGDDVIVKPPDTAGFWVKADGVIVRGFEIGFGNQCAPGILFEGSRNVFADNILAGIDPNCLGANALASRDPDGGSDNNLIEGNTLEAADVGIIIIAVSDQAINHANIIRDNIFKGINQNPIVVTNGERFLISGNQIDGAPYGICISLDAGENNHMPQGRHTVIKNTMENCMVNGISLHAWPGTVLTHNHVAENSIRYCGSDCLALQAEGGALLTHNKVISNTVSLSLAASGLLLSAAEEASVSNNLIEGNLVYHNALNGVYLTSGADRNKIINNEVQTNREVGIAIAGNKNQIVGNQLFNNTLDIADLGQDNIWLNNSYTPIAGWAIGMDAAGAPAISHTTDGGRTWQAQTNLPVSAGQGADISAVDDQTAWATVASSDADADGALLHTSDGGATWVAQNLPDGVDGGIKVVKGVTANEAWAASLYGAILHTTDGGVTWNIVPHPDVTISQVNRIDANSAGDVWIANVNLRTGGADFVVHSPDGGLTWREESLPGVEPNNGPLAINAYDSQVIWSAVNYQGDFFRTIDGGAQWSKVASVAGADDFDDICAASKQAVWGVLNLSGNSGGNIFRVQIAEDGSVDSQMFKPAPDYQYEGITCLDDQIAWVAGLRSVSGDSSLPLGVTLFTIDGGATWVQGSGALEVAFWKTSFVGARR